MKLSTIQDRIWALHPAKLQEIEAVISGLLCGRKIDREAWDRAESRTSPADVPGHIAVIDIFGTVTRRANLFSNWSGGTSTEIAKKEFAKALEDPKIRGILLNVDSPGGSVDGIEDLSRYIVESRGKKPVLAYVDGMMTSAAYWIGSSADRIVSSPTSMIGSIGVVLMHYDLSGRDAKDGIVRSEIYAGRYKRIASDTRPLSDEGRQYLQDLVDRTFAIFVESVGRNRGMSFDQALEAAGESRVYMASEAMGVGLIDELGTFNAAINQLQRSIEMEETKLNVSAGTDAVQTEPPVEKALEFLSADPSVLEENARLTREIAQLKKSLRIEQLDRRIRQAVSEFKLTPAAADNPKLVEALYACDELTVRADDGSEWNVGAFFMETFIEGTQPRIESPDRHVANNTEAVPAQAVDSGIEIGKRIAEKANRLQKQRSGQ